LAVVRPEPLDTAHEDAERGRVDERGVAEVDDHVRCALCDHLEELLLELRRRVEVDLSGQRDDVHAVCELFGLDVEVHCLPPGRSRESTGGLSSMSQCWPSAEPGGS